MATQRVKGKRRCAYCGRASGTTNDHIPPKNLFPRPRPNNLITVPACPKCHDGLKKDDDYFWLMLAGRAENGTDPSAADAAGRAVKHLSRPEARPFREAFLRSVHEVELESPAGVYLGRGVAYEADSARLNRVAARIIRGLFYHVTGRPLPEGYACRARSTVDPEPGLVEAVDTLVPAATETSIGAVFSYRFAFSIEDTNLSVWYLTFYGTTGFLGFTLTGDMGRAVPEL